MERIVDTRLTHHMDRNNLNIDNQFGYKKYYSTETLLVKIVNNLLLSFDNNIPSVVLLLDLSAAFDTVNQKKLLDILFGEIDIVGTANNVKEGVELVNSLQPNLIFLDIQMPEMDGFTLLENLTNRKFNLIFTTAHDEFALKAIKVSAIDYLLKPVDKDELMEAIEKIQEQKKGGLLEDKLQMLLGNINETVNDKINISYE